MSKSHQLLLCFVQCEKEKQWHHSQLNTAKPLVAFAVLPPGRKTIETPCKISDAVGWGVRAVFALLMERIGGR
jgi:hypothetical protein